jgi:hypothetical protein
VRARGGRRLYGMGLQPKRRLIFVMRADASAPFGLADGETVRDCE